ncbi:MAG: hypothetical protein GY869_16170 [Planctomycetes bacterium]|nr:hypothetical protein [Planctomycetota bacterium]
MSKAELIDAVRELNSTASKEFLSQFNERQLQEYIDHLLEVDFVNLTAIAVSLPPN